MAAHASLNQRIVVRQQLGELGRSELEGHLRQRLQRTGCELALLEPEALEASGLGAGPHRSALLQPRLRARRGRRDRSGHACRGLQLRRGRRVPRAPLRAASGRSGRGGGRRRPTSAAGRPGASSCAPRTAAAPTCSTPMPGATPSSSAAIPAARLPAPNWSGRDPTPAVAPSRASPPARARRAASGCRPPAPQAVLLVESALDALSVRQCPPPGLPAAALIASTAGASATWPPWLDP